ncbi:MAG: aminoacetone oxidase family FAD-binding enzyme [Oscillospiraceae bacterium]|nr:aminoacetone oxidase family FAD-binding enzyme [Oscillospiraceae bacterium]
MTEVFIIGGGASGMAAALSAAQHPNRRVTLLERQGRVGRKLLATRNGRCNLTNLAGADIAHYHGADPAFAGGALRRYPPEAVLGFFSALGLMTRPEYGGRVYPMSGHAGSVLDVLLLALEQAGVRVCTAAAVQRAARHGGRFWLETATGGMTADKLIVACGGCAGGKLGGVQDGYTLLQGLGHSRTALSPALTALRTAPDYPRALKGIRADAVVRLLCGGRTLQTERGDVLFTENGVSGTAVFAVSRAAADVGKARAEISLNFFPDLDAASAEQTLAERRRRWPELPANRILTGTVQSRLGVMLCKYSGISGGGTAGTLTDGALRRLAAAMRDFRLPVSGVCGFDSAQVTAGGIRTAEFDPETLQSRLVPGLYACGEVLDIDGDCGGYNLQWAWSSGLLAGALN